MATPGQNVEKDVEPRSAADMAPVKSHPFIEKRGDKPPVGTFHTPSYKTNLNRFVRWPRYIRVQRQKAVLLKRMKVPPSIAQFKATMDKNQTASVCKILESCKPLSKGERAKEVRAIAAAKAQGQIQEFSKPNFLSYGIKDVVSTIQKGKAKMVIIAADVDPIELVIYLPALCRKMQVPFAFIGSKARLGRFVGQKTVTAVAIMDVPKENKTLLGELSSTFMHQYNDNVELRRSWGGSIMSKAFYKKQEEIAKIVKKQ